MFRSSKALSRSKSKSYALVMLALMPLMAGCDAVTASVWYIGTSLWTEIVFTPVRSALGALALDFINSI